MKDPGVNAIKELKVACFELMKFAVEEYTYTESYTSAFNSKDRKALISQLWNYSILLLQMQDEKFNYESKEVENYNENVTLTDDEETIARKVGIIIHNQNVVLNLLPHKGQINNLIKENFEPAPVDENILQKIRDHFSRALSDSDNNPSVKNASHMLESKYTFDEMLQKLYVILMNVFKDESTKIPIPKTKAELIFSNIREKHAAFKSACENNQTDNSYILK